MKSEDPFGQLYHGKGFLLTKIIGFLIIFIFVDVEMKAIGVKSVLDFPTKQGMVLTMVEEDMEAMAHLVVVEVVQVVVEVDL